MGTPLYKISASAVAYAIPKTGSDGKLTAGFIPDLTGTYQAYSAELAAVAALSSTGVVRRTGANTWSAAALSAGDLPTHTHGAGDIASGTLDAARIPDLSAIYQPLDADLTAIAALSSTGFARRTGANTWSVAALSSGDLPSHAHSAADVTNGTLALARGGTNTDLSATGGSNQFLKQSTTGGAVSVAAILSADLTSALTTPPAIGGTTPAAITGTTLRANNDLTLAGAPGKIKPAANSVTALQVAQADGTAFVTFDSTNKRLGINTTAPSDDLHLGTGAIRFTGTYGPSGDLRLVESGGAITIEAASVTAKFRLLPFGNEVYFQNTLSTGGMRFSGPAGGNLDGNYIFYMAASSRMGLSTTGPAAKLHLVDRVEGSSSSGVNAFILERTETGTPLAGFGQNIVFRFKSSTTDSRDAAYIKALWNDPANAAAIGDLVLVAAHNAAGAVTEREGVRVRGGASATQIGFFGTTPAAKPAITGSRGGNAALADLLTKLATLGLITDSTSA